ncbi:MAG: parallel beta-helix domain-containing protein [Bacteroidota bacterium]
MHSYKIIHLSFLLGLSTVGLAQKEATPNFQDIEKKLQTQFILAEAGDVILLEEGNFRFKGSLSMDDKKNITIRGKGMDKTILSFKGQTEGAEGLHISNGTNITLEGFTVQDSKGDGIKVKDTDGITFRDIKVVWTDKAGQPSSREENGGYGLYPVMCNNVLIEKCETRGASDAGIYVGQSKNIIVRNNRVTQNVAGIEIENSQMADVYDNDTYQNTGGILVFDLPGLAIKKGGNTRVYNNRVRENNFRNFAPKGNIVAKVPSGTGIMVLATSGVEIFNNQITNNRTINTSIVSYYITEEPIKDTLYDPYPTAIYIHDNTYQRQKRSPSLKSRMGKLLFLKFGKQVPDILYDGIVNTQLKEANGKVKPEAQICLRNNGNATFANLDAENKFKNISRDMTPYNCEHQPLKAASLSLKE